MKETAAARRYAKAFLDTFAGAGAKLDAISVEIRAVARAIADSHDLKSLLLNPAISEAQKRGIIEGVMKAMNTGREAAGAVFLALTKGRIGLLPEIADEFEKMAFEALGKVRVDVSTAMDLSADEEKELLKTLGKLTGKTAVLTVKNDPTLIGGIVVKIGSLVYDGSVSNQLKSLRVGI
ncbi:ATP synthase F1 subunit delta [Candidatus Saganbacteria bacterium]|uniref:ATP synthase subunit delta n=1 Tax=Candidatus Saganbacteria bacterium TaxID=2575572 RepID=A0A9D6UM50_UNCSA|nr:ATP synthase F1 subunit delta [Candidatus Saganbacteria bacterium]